MQSLVLIICLAFSFIVIGCGNHIWEKEDRGSNVASSETILDEESELPDFKLGECQGEFGCLRGFISHGMSLVIEPEVASDSVDRVDGEQVLLEAKVFRDAQDFGDRFDREFLLPLIPEDLRSNYTVSITPRVTRDNFAAGFELYSEGITAQDNRLSMEGEGNFTLGDILPYDRVALRAVKHVAVVKAVQAVRREWVVLVDQQPAIGVLVRDVHIVGIFARVSVQHHTTTSGGDLLRERIDTEAQHAMSISWIPSSPISPFAV